MSRKSLGPPRGKSLAPPGARPRDQPRTEESLEPTEATIDRLGMDGEGIARWNGRALFVRGALAGERVRVAPELGGKVVAEAARRA